MGLGFLLVFKGLCGLGLPTLPDTSFAEATAVGGGNGQCLFWWGTQACLGNKSDMHCVSAVSNMSKNWEGCMAY